MLMTCERYWAIGEQATAGQNAIEFQVSRIDRIENTATTVIEQSAKVNDRLTVVEMKQVTADAIAGKFRNDTLSGSIACRTAWSACRCQSGADGDDAGEGGL